MKNDKFTQALLISASMQCLVGTISAIIKDNPWVYLFLIVVMTVYIYFALKSFEKELKTEFKPQPVEAKMKQGMLYFK